MNPKLLLFSAAFILGVPALTLAGIVVPPVKNILMALLCFSLCYPEALTVNFFSREIYRVATRGVEVGLIDIVALALFLIMVIQPRGQRFRWFPPLTVIYGIYILIALISWTLTPGNIPVPAAAQNIYSSSGTAFYTDFETSLYPLFEISKILRGGFIYLVVVNFLRDEESFRVVLGSLLMVVFVITAEALFDRYIRGFHRISATLGHPNSLGTFMSMLGTLMFGVALFRATFVSSSLYAMGTVAALVSVILTISRGALSAIVMGIWIDVSSLFHRYINLKNFTILFLGSLMVLGLFFVAADTITARFLGQQDAISDIEYRGLYNEEAKGMARDHLFGVGPGNFSAYSWTKYAAQVGLQEPGTPAHNLWYLTLGEMGFPGLFAFILYWMRFYSIGLPSLFRRRTAFIYAVAVSATAATMIGHIQFMLQLSYRQNSIYMLTKILMGIVVASWYVDRDIRRKEGEARRLARRTSNNRLPA